MLYKSTFGDANSVPFKDACLTGLAPDGGLYMPESIPQFSSDELTLLKGAPLQKIAEVVLQKWIGDTFTREDIRDIATQGLTFPLPFVSVGDVQVLELFHGPTHAFKDVAAGILAQILSRIARYESRTIHILVATSGDTGGAIAQAFSSIKDAQVSILFPPHVSKLQRQQLTGAGPSVHAYEVQGSFDDCQALVKRAFTDPELLHLHLTSANSINIARLIPQIIYHVYAWSRYPHDLSITIPSGNMGNACAAILAHHMGVPISHILIATNANDAVSAYARYGNYVPQKTVPTLSNAMDVGNPNNFPRIMHLLDKARFNRLCEVASVSDADTTTTIQHTYAQHGYILDPHTAVGMYALQRSVRKHLNRVLISTASPLKFAYEIEKTAGIIVPQAHTSRQYQPERCVKIANSYTQLKEKLLSFT
jgi:threonine synthase